MGYTLIETDTFASPTTSAFYTLPGGYDIYEFVYYDINPDADNSIFGCQFNVVGGSGWNETITSTALQNYNSEAGSSAMQYDSNLELNQSTSRQRLGYALGSGSDESCAGTLRIYNNHSTTYPTRFLATTIQYHYANYLQTHWVSGIINTTAAVDDVLFDFTSGGAYGGTVRVYGIS